MNKLIVIIFVVKLVQLIDCHPFNSTTASTLNQLQYLMNSLNEILYNKRHDEKLKI